MFETLLDSFVNEQNSPRSRMTSTYVKALEEIKTGEKTSHWIWYVIPSWKPIRNTMMPEFLLPSTEAVVEYMKHDELNKRLIDIIDAATEHLKKGVSSLDIFGDVDNEKFHETTSLFAIVAAFDKTIKMETVDCFINAIRANNINPTFHERTVQELSKIPYYSNNPQFQKFLLTSSNSTSIDELNDIAKEIRE